MKYDIVQSRSGDYMGPLMLPTRQAQQTQYKGGGCDDGHVGHLSLDERTYSERKVTNHL